MPWAVARGISGPGAAVVRFDSTSAAEHRPRMRWFDCVWETLWLQKSRLRKLIQVMVSMSHSRYYGRVPQNMTAAFLILYGELDRIGEEAVTLCFSALHRHATGKTGEAIKHFEQVTSLQIDT